MNGMDLSEIPLITLKKTKWIYRGEGNANLVVALPEEKLIVRMQKSEYGTKISREIIKLREQKLRRDMDFYIKIIVPFLGKAYMQPPILGKILEEEIKEMDSRMLKERPSSRTWKGVHFGMVTVHPDYTCLPPVLSTNVRISEFSNGYSPKTNNKDSTYCIEIKPKQGWVYPSDRRHPKCTYCLNQYLKVLKKKIYRISHYCPLDLFSGNVSRMKRAMKHLLDSPQNNLKIFQNGRLIYSDDTQRSYAEILEEWLEPCENGQKLNIERLVDKWSALLTKALMREMTEEPPYRLRMVDEFLERDETKDQKCFESPLSGIVEPCDYTASVLPDNCVLHRILMIQKLQMIGFPLLYKIYRQTKDTEDDYNYVNRLLYSHEPPGVMERYLLSTTAKDCSIFIAFQRTKTRIEDDLHYIQDCDGNTYKMNIGVSDIDPKPLSCIDKHYERDKDVVAAILHYNEIVMQSEHGHYCGCLTFIAKRRSHDLCGSNGLPLTSNSIKILGRAQYLKTLCHPNIFSYVDILRGKHERTILVSEHTGVSLSGCVFKNWLQVLSLARDLLRALSYLHKRNVIHRSLCKRNIYFSNNQWKLFNFGLYFMTASGEDVLFPIGYLRYSAPDVILEGPYHKSCGKADVWSLGVIIVELLLGCDLWKEEALDTILKFYLTIVESKNVFYQMAKLCNRLDMYNKLPKEVISLVDKLLIVNPTERPSAREILREEIFILIDFENCVFRSYEKNVNHMPLNKASLLELYHYWQLAGGDVCTELRKEGLIRTNPPIISLPNVLMLEGTYYGQKTNEAVFLDEQIVFLNTDHLIKRFTKLFAKIQIYNSFNRSSEFNDGMASLPLAIKERDTDYQFRRIRLFKGIIKNRQRLLKEAKQDIPPFIRAKIWANILGISPNYKKYYKLIDKETPLVADRQIEVDIPRCHQYNELLSSSAGHCKFKRILKAWVKCHPQYVYWQGLDSLCAPFLFLNFYNEAHAYASLEKFIDKYLHNFFLRDNTAVIREYLAKFKHLIAFLDPTLANHLHEIGFSPELFAIPWFLTLFSHVFPIQKILHLWDTLLLGDASYPLFIGFSILQQLRSILLSSGFNECILLFSDLPEIDIEKCMEKSIFYYQCTPKSVTFRRYELKAINENISIINGENFPDITLEDLQNETSPRICAMELRKIILNPSLKSKILLLDIRHPTVFKLYCIPGSVNVHGIDLKGDNNHLQKTELSILQTSKGKIVVVVGDNVKPVSEFCHFLVTLGIPKVCGLNGGLTAIFLEGKLLF